MNRTHSIIDNSFFAILLILPLIEWRWTWPRYLAQLAAGAPGVRAAFYRTMIVEEWIPALCLVGYWAAKARPWSWLLLAGTATPLKLGIPPQLRLWSGLAFAVLLAGVLVLQRLALLARPGRVQRIRPKLAFAEPLLPHTAGERKLFWLASLTAGVCEELFFRGFLIWYFSLWTGPLFAALLSSVVFGAGHVYLGLAQVPRTALVGLFLAIVAFASASLLPAMLLHAAMDWNSGELGFRALREENAASSS